MLECTEGTHVTSEGAIVASHQEVYFARAVASVRVETTGRDFTLMVEIEEFTAYHNGRAVVAPGVAGATATAGPLGDGWACTIPEEPDPAWVAQLFGDDDLFLIAGVHDARPLGSCGTSGVRTCTGRL